MTPQKTFTSKEISKLSEEILALKKEKNAVILAHYYQELPIQDLADLVGDSLGLSKAARDVEDAEMIVFAGVYFMAETAKILNPTTKVLIPNKNAGCPLANQCSVNMIEDARTLYGQDIPVVVYVNTTAATKAAADVTCTSSNAATVVKNLKTDKVIFGPDRNLGYYVEQKLPEIKLYPVPEDGHCYVHRKFDLKSILDLKQKYPKAAVIAHPECNPEIQQMADEVGSTAAIKKFVETTSAKTIIVATEKGMVDRLDRDYPDKKVLLAKENAICRNMKKNNLENLRDALKFEQHEVIIPKEIHDKAEKAILKMFELTK